MQPTISEESMDPTSGEDVDSSKLDQRDFFIGPKGENLDFVEELIREVIDGHKEHRKNIQTQNEEKLKSRYEYKHHSNSHLEEKIKDKLKELNNKLGGGNDEFNDELDSGSDKKSGTPIFSPHYIAHMLTDPIFLSVVGKIAGDLWYQNNIDQEVSKKTTEIEREVIKMLQEIVGYHPFELKSNKDGYASWGRLSSCGTTANLDALCMARNKALLVEKLHRILITEDFDMRSECMDFRIPEKYIDKNGLPRKASALLKTVAKDNGEIDSLYWKAIEKLEDGCSRELDRLRDEPREESRNISNISDEEFEKLFNKEKKKNIRERMEKLNLLQNPYSLIDLYFNKKENIRQPVIIYTKEAHYSIKKCISGLGLGFCEEYIVNVDKHGRMEMACLEKKIKKILNDGTKILAAVVVTLGTTELGAVDPLHKVLKLRERIHDETGEWFLIHADAAWGAPLRLLDEHSYPYPSLLKEDKKELEALDKESWEAFNALKDADSITFDPHKLLFVVYPAGAVLYKDGRDRHFVGIKAPYLWTKEKEDISQGKNSLEGTKPCSSATAVWLTLKVLKEMNDYEVYKALFRQQLSNTRYLYAKLKTVPGIVFEGPPQTNLLCFRLQDFSEDQLYQNKLTEYLYEKLNAGEEKKTPEENGKFFISNSDEVAGKKLYVIRVVPINPFITTEYLDEFIEDVRDKTEKIQSEGLSQEKKVSLIIEKAFKKSTEEKKPMYEYPIQPPAEVMADGN